MTEPEVPPNDPLPPPWIIAAMNLASGHSYTDAARAAGVTRKTLYRWRRRKRFQEKVNEIRDAMISKASGQLAAKLTAGIEALEKLLDDENPAVRLRAADSIINSTLRVRNATDMASRIAAIERRISQ